MNDGILSQEEIDALLRGQIQAEADQTKSRPEMSDIEEDTLGEIGNICMGTSATTLSTLLGKKVRITTPRIKYTSRDQLRSDYPLPYVVVEVEYREGLKGTNILVIKKEDASVIADLMMGGGGKIEELNDLSLSAVSEAMNQMMGSATTSMSSMFDQRIDINPPRTSVVDLASDDLALNLDLDSDALVQISFRMEIEDLVDSEIMQLIPISYAREMVGKLMKTIPDAEVESAPVYSPPDPIPEIREVPLASKPPWEEPAVAWDSRSSATGGVPGGVKKGQVAVRPVQFAGLDETPSPQEIRNIDIIMDVPLDISVELGKTKKSIKEILELGPGSIIQLDKLAGEPVDLLVNGKLIAKGEVVVIDENYGIRISAIVSPLDRMTKLQ